MWLAIRYFNISSYANKRPSLHSQVDDSELSNTSSSRPMERKGQELHILAHHTYLRLRVSPFTNVVHDFTQYNVH